MKKKGIGSVVSYILIALITIVAITIFLGVYLRSVDKNTSGDTSSCFGIDLKLNNCIIIPISLINGPFGLDDSGPAIIANVERFPGGDEVKGLRFVVKDFNGNTHLEEPINFALGNFVVNTNYSDFVEYDSDNALLRNLTYRPVSVAVSAVVGKSETVCNPTREPIVCKEHYPLG